MKANEILDQAVECIADRGARYNTGEERSMRNAVGALNAITGRNLTEAEGWLLMALVKLVRAQGTPDDPDHYIDAAGYAALLGESRLRGAERAAEGVSFVSVGEGRVDGDAAERARQWCDQWDELKDRTYKGWDYQP